MNEHELKVIECRKEIFRTLNDFPFDIGVEALISLLALSPTAVPVNRREPLLKLILRGIRDVYKEAANVQLRKDSEAKRELAIADRQGESAGIDKHRSPVRVNPPPGPVEGVQPNPSGND